MTETSAKRIQNAAELGRYLREHRQGQASTIRNTSHFTNLGERFISEIERGKASASLNKTLQYINLLGLSLHLYPRHVLSIKPPYGAYGELESIGALLRHHRKIQGTTLETVKQLSGLGLRFLSDFERGKNCQIGKAFLAFKTYGLVLAIAPKHYRLNKADLLNG